MSFDVIEKKAISLPENKKDNKNKISMAIIRIVVAAGEINKKLNIGKINSE
jgi:hypothetical protein